MEEAAMVALLFWVPLVLLVAVGAEEHPAIARYLDLVVVLVEAAVAVFMVTDAPPVFRAAVLVLPIKVVTVAAVAAALRVPVSVAVAVEQVVMAVAAAVVLTAVVEVVYHPL